MRFNDIKGAAILRIDYIKAAKEYLKGNTKDLPENAKVLGGGIITDYAVKEGSVFIYVGSISAAKAHENGETVYHTNK